MAHDWQVQELRFGDNDKLSAMVAVMLQAKWLFLLTDVDGLYTKNPKTHPDAEIITLVPDIFKLKVDTAVGPEAQWGTGGLPACLPACRIPCLMGRGKVVCILRPPS